jgi:hypothetical protein
MGIAFFAVSYVLRFIRRILTPLAQPQKTYDESPNKDDKILYRKDDIVVLKGEAKERDDK